MKFTDLTTFKCAARWHFALSHCGATTPSGRLPVFSSSGCLSPCRDYTRRPTPAPRARRLARVAATLLPALEDCRTRVRGIPRYLPSVWLLSASMMSSRCIRVVAGTRISFLFKAEQYPIVRLDHAVYPLVAAALGFSHLLAAVNGLLSLLRSHCYRRADR